MTVFVSSGFWFIAQEYCEFRAIFLVKFDGVEGIAFRVGLTWQFYLFENDENQAVAHTAASLSGC